MSKSEYGCSVLVFYSQLKKKKLDIMGSVETGK